MRTEKKMEPLARQQQQRHCFHLEMCLLLAINPQRKPVKTNQCHRQQGHLPGIKYAVLKLFTAEIKTGRVYTNVSIILLDLVFHIFYVEQGIVSKQISKIYYIIKCSLNTIWQKLYLLLQFNFKNMEECYNKCFTFIYLSLSSKLSEERIDFQFYPQYYLTLDLQW